MSMAFEPHTEKRLLPHLKSSAFYRGQIYRVTQSAGAAGNVHAADDAVEMLATSQAALDQAVRQLLDQLGVVRLLDPQVKALQRLLAGEDIVYAAPPGSGRSLVAQVGCLLSVLERNQHALILCASEGEALHRAQRLNGALEASGLDYAVEASVGLNGSIPPGILVLTPERLWSLHVSGQLAWEKFLHGLGFLVVEEVHRHTGTPGGYLQLTLRLVLAMNERWAGRPCQILATGLGYANIVAFVASLTGRDDVMDLRCLITEGETGGRTAKTWIFWNPPLVWNDETKVFKRSGHIEDMRELIRYLGQVGLPDATRADAASASTLILVDVSGGLSAAARERIARAVAADAAAAQGPIILRPFHKKLLKGRSLPSTVQASTIMEVLAKAQPRRSVEPASARALLDALQGHEQAGVTHVLVYSGSSGSVSRKDAAAVVQELERFRRQSAGSRFLHVAVDHDVSTSTRQMIRDARGRWRALDTKAEGDWRPSVLLATDDRDDRPLLVMTDGAVVEGDLALTDLADARRRILFHDITAVAARADEISGHLMGRAKYVVVAGWQSSAGLLEHVLQKTGLDDTVVFVCGTPDAASQARLRQWNLQQGTPRDVLCRGAISPAMVRRVLAWGLGRCLPSKGLLARVVPAGVPVAVSSGDGADASEPEQPLTQWSSVVTQGLPASYQGRTLWFDRLEPLRRLIPSGDWIKDGYRYRVSYNHDQWGVEDIVKRSACAWLKAEVSWYPLEIEAGKAEKFLLAVTLQRCRAHIRVRPKRVDTYPDYRYDEPPASSNPLDDAPPLSFRTSALRVNMASPDASRCAGLAALLHHYLTPLIKADSRALLIVPSTEGDAVLIALIADGDTALPQLLLDDAGALLREALTSGLRALLQCPCPGRATGRDAASDDCGCPWCLAAPLMLPLLNTPMQKRELTAWLGELLGVHPPVTDRLQHKYERFADDHRLSGQPSGAPLTAAVLSIMHDKLGIDIPPDRVATVRFAGDGELPESVLGRYQSTDQSILLCPDREFDVLATLAHEYAHNWQSCCLWQAGSAGQQLAAYHDDCVRDETNIPFRGRLFLEGSAVWVQSHVMDYYAYRSHLDEIGLVQPHQSGFEYWQGLRVLKYLENRYGMGKVLAFLADADIRNASDGDLKNLGDLYRESGLTAFLVTKGRDAISLRQLPMLAGQNLAEPVNLARISAWLSLRLQRIDQWDGDPEMLPGVTLRCLLPIEGMREAMMDTPLAALVEGGDPAHDLSLWLAAHLVSSAEWSTSALMATIEASLPA